jgi:hypothetical protein
MNKVGIIIIATGKYDVFLRPLIDSIDKYFFRSLHVDIFIFSDKESDLPTYERLYLYWAEIEHIPFPFATLYRYRHITRFSEWLTSDNLYYIDVDMLLVDEVGDEILPDESGLVAVHHPGFYAKGGWGDNGTPIQSRAYLTPSLRNDYFAGGFQGGERTAYLKACKLMSEDIDIDLDTAKEIGWENNSGVLARYHDESFWNKYLKYHPFKALTPRYCMVEELNLRELWGISDIKPAILALHKDHKKFRQ